MHTRDAIMLHTLQIFGDLPIWEAAAFFLSLSSSPFFLPAQSEFSEVVEMGKVLFSFRM